MLVDTPPMISPGQHADRTESGDRMLDTVIDLYNLRRISQDVQLERSNSLVGLFPACFF